MQKLTLITEFLEDKQCLNILSLNCNLVIFCPKNKYNDIWQYRKKNKLLSKTCIVYKTNESNIIDFIDKSIKSNYFSSSYFCWINYDTNLEEEFFPENFIDKLIFNCDDKIHFISLFKNNIYRFSDKLYLFNFDNAIIFIDIMNSLLKNNTFLDSHNICYLNNKNNFISHIVYDEKKFYLDF